MSSTLFTPYKLGPVTLRNRTIRSAAFESMGKDFGPTRQLKDYHVAVARGGVPRSSPDCAKSPTPCTAKGPPRPSRSDIAAT